MQGTTRLLARLLARVAAGPAPKVPDPGPEPPPPFLAAYRGGREVEGLAHELPPVSPEPELTIDWPPARLARPQRPGL